LAVESIAGSLAGERTLQIDGEGVAHRVDEPALASPVLRLDVVRAPPRRSFGTEPSGGHWAARGTNRGDVRGVGDAFPAADPGGFTATPTSRTGPFTAPSKAESLGDVLGRWRAAERRLDMVDAGSVEYESTVAQISELRAHYQRLFEARLGDA
jgi:hypothetical protein